MKDYTHACNGECEVHGCSQLRLEYILSGLDGVQVKRLWRRPWPLRLKDQKLSNLPCAVARFL